MKKIATQEMFKSAAEIAEGLIRDRLPVTLIASDHRRVSRQEERGNSVTNRQLTSELLEDESTTSVEENIVKICGVDIRYENH